MLVLTLASLTAPPAGAAPLPTRSPGPEQALGPHARQALELGAAADAARTVSPPARGPLPMPTPGPDLRVYGYLAYWDNDLGSVPWDDITDLAVFSAGADSDGTLFDTWKWDIVEDAVLLAEPYGVRVHLCVTNFDSASLNTLLSSATARQTLIDQLVGWQAATGAHGVNIDFENLPAAVKSQMVTFTRDLEAAVGEVVLATPPVDWSGAWDYDALAQHADLFVMGYGYHWGGSAYAGPTDPLYAGAGTVWSGIQSYSLASTVADYTDPSYGADPARVILGLPLYGMSWPVGANTVPATTQGGGSSVVFSAAWEAAATHGRSWEADSLTPWTHDGAAQIWYGDEESVRERIAWVRDQTGLAGIGFWALHYDGDDPSFWSMVREETTSGATDTTGTPDTGTPTTTDDTDPGPSPDWVADAGLPFLAYVGDMVVLSGLGSRGPEGVAPQYRWVQLSGPAVALSSTSDPQPSFRVEHPGTHVFELLVGDGTTWSAPARSYLVVIDPDLPNRHASGCGCSGTTSAPAPLVLALLLATCRRRRRE